MFETVILNTCILPNRLQTPSAVAYFSPQSVGSESIYIRYVNSELQHGYVDSLPLKKMYAVGTTCAENVQ